MDAFCECSSCHPSLSAPLSASLRHPVQAEFEFLHVFELNLSFPGSGVLEVSPSLPFPLGSSMPEVASVVACYVLAYAPNTTHFPMSTSTPFK